MDAENAFKSTTRVIDSQSSLAENSGQLIFDFLPLNICDAPEKLTLGHDPDALLFLKFPDAANLWLETRKPYLRLRTWALYQHHISTLSKFFADIFVGKINIGDIRRYQAERICNHGRRWKNCAGPSLIRHELWIVEAVLKRAGRWHHIGPYYEPLPLPLKGKPKVMTESEEKRLFGVAQTDSEFQLAYIVAGLTVNTSAAGSELRNIRLRDIDLKPPKPSMTVDADTAKNQGRARTIPLNASALFFMEMAVALARTKGAIHPDHYLFPKRIVRGIWDPYKPASASWLRNSFTALREAADLPWLTPHCLRHQCGTKLLELGVAPETVRSIMGHVTEDMMRHYCHTRYSAASDALSKIDSGMSVRPTENNLRMFKRRY